jgi:uncharacterized protein YbjQ (UPF0145 family)
MGLHDPDADDDDIRDLLAEIRDIQREHLEHYKLVSERNHEIARNSMKLQAEAVGKQRVAMYVLVVLISVAMFSLYAAMK